MKKFKINVNGVAYDVEVEEVKSTSSSMPQTTAPVAQSTPAVETATPAPTAAVEAAPVVSGAETVDAPMPGTILSIATQAGAQVKAGDVLLVLEAKKMENEIVAPRDGEVAAVHVNVSAVVDAGQALVSLK